MNIEAGDTRQIETPYNPLLRELELEELELLKVIWLPVCDAANYTKEPVWPVWDFVARTLMQGNSDFPDPIEVLMGLPSIPILGSHGATYGLVWVENNSTSALGGNEKIGLTIAGFAQLAANGELAAPVHDKLSTLICEIAIAEEAFHPNPLRRVETQLELDGLTSWFTEVTDEKKYVISVDVVARTLQREYARIAISESIGKHQVWISGLWLRHFRRLSNAQDYIKYIGNLAATARSATHTPSPLTLVQTIDYLSYVLSAHPGWNSSERLVKAPDLQSATAFVLPVQNKEEFESRMNGVWNVIDRFQIPEFQEGKAHKNSPEFAPQGSISRLETWLSQQLDEEASIRVSEAFTQIRAVRRIRVADAHNSLSTRRAARQAHSLLGLPEFISNWPNAWEIVNGRLARAFDIIREEVQLSATSEL